MLSISPSPLPGIPGDCTCRCKDRDLRCHIVCNSDVFWFIQISKSMFLFQTKSDKEIQELDNYLISISIRMLRSLSDSSAMLFPGDHTADAPPAGVSACSSLPARRQVQHIPRICKSKDDEDNMLSCPRRKLWSRRRFLKVSRRGRG